MHIFLSGVQTGSRRGERIIAIVRSVAGTLHAKGDIEVVFLKNRAIRTLKKKLLPKNTGPANVLAVPEPLDFPHPESSSPPLGTLYINGDLTDGRPEREAQLLIHGFLHLVGYGHRRKRDILKMENIEQTLWRRISSLV